MASTQQRQREAPERLLERHGLRPTAQRVAIVAELARERDDVTAQRLHARMRSEGARIGLATVYRTLALLHERGVVDTIPHHPGELCYRVCGEDHHHHLVCSSCHRVVELAGCELEEWLGRAAERHGFIATGHRLEVTGLCPGCQRKASAPHDPAEAPVAQAQGGNRL